MASSPSVEILIKAPSQRVNDFSLTCDLAWTIHQIKSQLANLYPTHPAADEQKLIYRGQLMRDHVQLKDVITSQDGNQREIFHLVCQNQTSLPVQASTTPEPGSEIGREDADSGSGQSQDVGNTQGDAGIRFRGAEPQPGGGSLNDYQWPAQQYGYTAPNQWQMYYWQMYASHMAAAAAAAAAAAHSGRGLPQTMPDNSANSPHSEDGPGRDAVDDNDDQHRQPAVANMLGDDEDEDDFAPRDWLDRLYAIVRFGFMLTIFFFYCTPTRFALLVIFSVAIALYQAGFLRLQRARVARGHVQAQQEEQNEHEEGAEEDAEASPPVEPNRPGALSILFGNVLAFFTSLIPIDIPQLAN